MKKWLLLLLITLPYYGLWAQEPLTLKGYIDNDHTYYGENQMIQNRLFVLEKADITPPSNIVFVNLSKESAQRVGQSMILLVPVFKDIYNDFLKCGGEITFEAIAFPNHKALYYTKKATCLDSDGQVATFEYQVETDGLYEHIISKNLFTGSWEYRDIPKWIAELDNRKTIQHRYELDTSAGSIYVQEETSSIAELALRILNEAHDTFDFIPIKKNAKKKQWQAWWQKVIHTDLSLCNAPAIVPLTETPTSYYEQLEYLGEITSDQSRLYAYDTVAKKHLYLSRYVSIESEQLPLITLDTERRKFLKQALEIPVKTYINHFYAKNDTLYTIDNRVHWKKYAPVAITKDSLAYRVAEEKTLLPEALKEAYIASAFTTSGYMYAIYSSRRSRTDFSLLCIDPTSGKVLGNQSLAALLPSPIIAITTPLLGDDLTARTLEEPVFIVYTEARKTYHLKFHKDTCIEKYLLEEKEDEDFQFDSFSYINNDNKSSYIGYQYARKGFDFWCYDPKNFPKGKQFFHCNDFTSYFRDTFVWATLGDKSYLIYVFQDGLSQGIKAQRFDRKTLKPIGAPSCVFSEIGIVPYRSSGLSDIMKISDLHALHSGNQWHITFTLRGQLCWYTLDF